MEYFWTSLFFLARILLSGSIYNIMTLQKLFDILKAKRFTLENEKVTQYQIEQVLIEHKAPYVREYFLDERSEPDFLVGDGIVIEVKIKGQKRKILQQILRYSNHPDVKAVLLITNVTLGDVILFENKPFKTLSLGYAWL